MKPPDAPDSTPTGPLDPDQLDEVIGGGNVSLPHPTPHQPSTPPAGAPSTTPPAPGQGG